MNKNYYAIIMAGGVGSRFWPVSTTEFPKQFHDMLGTGETLIQKTFTRLSQIIPKENILILTNEVYNDIVLEQLPMIQQEQIVLEPAMRNTAPCILYASLKIKKQNPDAIMVVAPSDHWIEDEVQFCSNLQYAFDKKTKENNPYQTEHDELWATVAAGEYKFADAENAAKSTMTAIMGRYATYSGKVVTWEEALNGTTVLNTIALTKGASILRVHDVREAVEAIKLYEAYSNA